MAYLANQIIVGAAHLYISRESFTRPEDAPLKPVPGAGETLLDAIQADAATGTGDWRHLGFTSEGVELSYEPDFGEVEVDQALDAPITFKQGMRVSVNTTLAEATLENLLVAWGQAANTYASEGAGGSDDAGTIDDETTAGADEFAIGIASGQLLDAPQERSMVFIGPAPRVGTDPNKQRVYHVRRAISVEASSMAARKTEATTIPVSMRLLPDTTKVGSEYGTIHDRVVTPTP